MLSRSLFHKVEFDSEVENHQVEVYEKSLITVVLQAIPGDALYIHKSKC